jgi:signal transduction histidine kinase
MSLRAQLVLAAGYLLIAAVVALEVPLDVSIDRRATQEFTQSLLSTTALVAGRINDDVATSAPGRSSELPPTSVVDAIGTITDAAAPDTAVRIVVTDRLGRVLADTSHEAQVGAQFASPERPEFGFVAAVPGGQVFVRERFSQTLDQELLVVAVPVIHDREVIGAVRATEPLGALHHRVLLRWLAFGLVGLSVVVAGLALAWFLATTLTRPVKRLERAAAELGGGNLEARAIPEGPAEVATLGLSFNHMADALSANIEAQREFVANASHQLRTPLTGLRLRLEAIREAGGFAAEQAGAAEREVDRLAALVDDLLELARASSVEATGSRVDLADVARRAVERWTQTAASEGKTVQLERDGTAVVLADERDLGHALDNLIENAIRYSPSGTEIVVTASRANGQLGRPRLAVADNGPGIPDDDRDRVFDRFYRGSTGRRTGSGTGLGLAIVAELVHRWGGEISLAKQEHGGGPGACIEATFPAAPTVP